MFKNLSLVIFLSVVLTSCNFFDTYEIVLDNPTENELSIVVDENVHTLEPFSHKVIKLKAKEYNFVVSAKLFDYHVHDHHDDEEHAHDEFTETIILDTMLTISQDGIFSPALHTYILWKDLYLENMDKYSDYAAKELNIKPQISINNKSYNDVDFTIISNQLFIPKNWDYGLFEPWSDNVDVYSKNFVVKSKVYRLEDLEEEWGYWGEFDMSDYTDEDFKNLLDSLLKREEVLLNEEL